MNNSTENRAKVIAVANQKGGVGKTTTSVNLGTALSKLKQKVLIIDFDTQNQIAKAFGLKAQEHNNIVNVLNQILLVEETENDFKNVVIHHEKENIDLVLAGLDLLRYETSIIGQSGQEQGLKLFVEKYRADYDYILIDCTPSLSVLLVNSLTACDNVIIPVQAQEYATDGLQELLKSIQKTKRFYNPTIEILGALITMVDYRTNYNRDMAENIKDTFKGINLNVFDTVIPRTIAMEETTSAGTSIHLHDSKNAGSIAYMNLANEVISHG